MILMISCALAPGRLSQHATGCWCTAPTLAQELSYAPALVTGLKDAPALMLRLVKDLAPRPSCLLIWGGGTLNAALVPGKKKALCGHQQKDAPALNSNALQDNFGIVVEESLSGHMVAGAKPGPPRIQPNESACLVSQPAAEALPAHLP